MAKRSVKATGKASLALHKKKRGKIETKAKISLKERKNLALAYTPGVAAVSLYLAEHPEKTGEYTWKGNTVAVISDGSAVLGLGNIGPEGAYPVMEGKALIFKEFANIDAVPIVLSTQDPEKIVQAVLAIAPSFGGINLEDIAAPQCFDIERRIVEALDMPVMHDDQHGTAIVVLAGLLNAMKVVRKDLNSARIVVSGVGAAGVAIMRLVKKEAPSARIIAVDSKGIVGKSRADLNGTKKALIKDGVIEGVRSGTLAEAIAGSDIFLGVSKAGALTKAMVRTMAERSVIFAMANPVPEIMPDEALASGAAVVATGRSDFPNQINNALAFPGIFRGALDKKISKITDDTKLRAARALAGLVAKPSAKKIIPDLLDPRIVKAVARSVQ
jgi:malate dehydrogenase (oxaloacetate-decarboxylating)